jgi:hypothetical protein
LPRWGHLGKVFKLHELWTLWPELGGKESSTRMFDKPCGHRVAAWDGDQRVTLRWEPEAGALSGPTVQQRESTRTTVWCHLTAVPDAGKKLPHSGAVHAWTPIRSVIEGIHLDELLDETGLEGFCSGGPPHCGMRCDVGFKSSQFTEDEIPIFCSEDENLRPSHQHECGRQVLVDPKLVHWQM